MEFFINTSHHTEISEYIITQIKSISFEKSISIHTRLSNLNIDSLLFVEMLIKLENEFNIQFRQEELVLSAFKTVGDLVDCISSNIIIERVITYEE